MCVESHNESTLVNCNNRIKYLNLLRLNFIVRLKDKYVLFPVTTRSELKSQY